MIKVSVIIPTYSPGEYIYECLSSIVSQTLSREEFETIIVLNGPKDPFYTQLKEFITKHSVCNFRLIYSEVSGVSNARNIGLDSARGEYVAFVDDDDIISSTYLDGLLAVSSPMCVGVSNGYAFVDNIDERIIYGITDLHRSLKGTSYSLLKYRTYLSPPVYKLIHRGIIGNIRFDTSMKISEDSLFCFKLSKNIREMRCADDSVIYFVRKREGSATRKYMSVSYIVSLTLKKIWLFTKIWISNPAEYNFPFFVSRILACIKHMKWLLEYSRLQIK